MDTKSEQLLKVATELMAALIVDDRIAWHKDPECYGNSYDNLADLAVKAAQTLIKKVQSTQL